MKNYEQILANVKFITKEDRDMLLKEFESLKDGIERLVRENSALEDEIEEFNSCPGDFDSEDLVSELEYRGIKMMPQLETMLAQDKLEKYIDYLIKNPCEP